MKKNDESKLRKLSRWRSLNTKKKEDGRKIKEIKAIYH